MRILAIEYSQSGDVTKAAEAFTRPLHGAGVDVLRVRLQSKVPYPYPWGGALRLFSVFPECFLGSANEIEPPGFRPTDRFDLVVLAYQVWFLCPSIPVQLFLRSEYARVLEDTPVITVCVSRIMWHSASETLKDLLRQRRAIHLDNIVVTHRGAPTATIVSVRRAQFYGRKDRLWGVFPPAELSRLDLNRLERLGAVVADRLSVLGPPYAPLLRGRDAVPVNRRYVVPELVAWYVYRAAARILGRLGAPGDLLRQMGLIVFIGVVLALIIVVLPIGLGVTLLLQPLIGDSVDRYVRRLQEPSGG
jgi:hypothetical protein